MWKNCLLMTSSINVDKRMPYHLHINNNERIKQYLDAILFYVTKSEFSDIIFCDWSWYPINKFRYLVGLARIYWKRFEILWFKNDQDEVVKRGKGYGEGKIIEYALHHSLLLKENNCFFKVTGRYIVKNINRIIRNESDKENIFFRISACDKETCNTAFFKVNKEFFNRYLYWAWDKVNDTNGVYFEHIYMKILKKHKKEISSFKELPVFSWVSGTNWKWLEPSWISILIGNFFNLLWFHRI